MGNELKITYNGFVLLSVKAKMKVIGNSKQLKILFVLVLLIITLTLFLFSFTKANDYSLESYVRYMEFLNKNNLVGDGCHESETIYQFEAKHDLGRSEVLMCLKNAKPALIKSDVVDGVLNINLRYTCAYNGHTGYREIYKNFEVDMCEVGWIN